MTQHGLCWGEPPTSTPTLTVSGSPPASISSFAYVPPNHITTTRNLHLTNPTTDTPKLHSVAVEATAETAYFGRSAHGHGVELAAEAEKRNAG